MDLETIKKKYPVGSDVQMGYEKCEGVVAGHMLKDGIVYLVCPDSDNPNRPYHSRDELFDFNGVSCFAFEAALLSDYLERK